MDFMVWGRRKSSAKLTKNQQILEEVIYQPAIINAYLLIFIWFSPST